MLELTLKSQRFFDERTSEFLQFPDKVLKLEHCLRSVSKWESKWQVPFLKTLSDQEMTVEQFLSYVQCMSLEPVDFLVLQALSQEDINHILEYMNEKMTATWFSKKEPSRNGRAPQRPEIVTAEIMYYWLVALQIPFEVQDWHLNRMLTLVEVCNRKNDPPKNMSRSDILKQNKAINSARLKAKRPRR